MSAFEVGLIGLVALSMAMGAIGPRAAAARRHARDRGAAVVFVVAIAFLSLARHRTDPAWTPHGVDWDSWLQSAAALVRRDVPWPPERWPLFAWTAALVHAGTRLPLHVAAQVASLGATAAAAAGIWRIVRRLAGTPAAVAASALFALLPAIRRASECTSGYPLWSACAVWACVGIAEASSRKGRVRPSRSWWLVAGAGIGGVLATMDKGLGPGLALGCVAAASILVGEAGAGRFRSAGLVAVPVVLLAVAYAAWPVRLTSLDTRMDLARMEIAARTDPDPSQAPLPVNPEANLLESAGWVFGQSMAPWTVTRTIASAGAGGAAPVGYPTAGVLRLALPGFGVVFLGVLGIGAVAGLGAARGRAWGWLAVLATAAGVAPSLAAEINLRFLLPAFAMVPVLGAGAVAAPVRMCGPWVRALPFLLLPIAALPGSPWRGASAIARYEAAIDHPPRFAMGVRADVSAMFPDATVDYIGPGGPGLIIVSGQDAVLAGQTSTGPPLRPVAMPDPRHHLVVYADPGREVPGAFPRDRAPVRTWQDGPHGARAWLFAPDDGGEERFREEQGGEIE